MVLVSDKPMKLYSTYWSYCHGHALPPHWSTASPLARHGGTHDHPRLYHGIVLRGRRADRGHPHTPRGPPLAQRGRHLGAVACPQRWGEPALLSLVDARLSAVISAASRAHPALSSPQNPSGLDTGVLGRPDRARRHRHLRHRVGPSHA